MAFQKKAVDTPKEVRLILTDTGVEIPVKFSFEGKDYELKPDGLVPEGLAKKLSTFSQYEEYDEKNERHVQLVEEKDTRFVTRKHYGVFEIQREIDLLSPSQKDEVIAFIKQLKNPVLPEVHTADEAPIN